MTVEDGLAELKDLYSRKGSLTNEEGEAWVERVSELLHRWVPERAAEFDELAPLLFTGSLSSQVVGPVWQRMGGMVRAAIADLERANISDQVPSDVTNSNRSKQLIDKCAAVRSV